MNLNINPMGSNNRNVNFGMAVKVDKNALSILKKQALGLSEAKYDTFWKSFDEAVERQADNPVDIIVRKCKHRDALAAEIVDNGEAPLKNKVFSQSTFFPSGLKFLNKAEKQADQINDMNSRIGKYEKAIADDYRPNESVIESRSVEEFED